MLKVLVGFLVAAALAVEADEKTWDLKFSDPDRDGKFLNVPIFYGNWVPITKAKAAIDYVAASLDDSARRNDEVPLQPQTEPPPPVTETPAKPEVVSQDEILDRIEDPSQISYTHYRRPVIGPEPLPFGHDRHHQGHVRRPLRRQDHPKGNRRNHRKLPSPSSAQSGGLVNSISSFFGGGGLSTQGPTTSRPTTQSGVFNFGQVFNIPTFLAPKTPIAAQKPGYISEEPVETILYHTPVIKTVEAPDLTKLGPPVIELGGDHDAFDGEIVVGQHKPDDHLSGFYSVDFDDFSTGDSPKKPRKTIVEEGDLEKAPKKLSVLVSGGPISDDIQLAKLFKDGRMDGDKHKAFISKPDGQVPHGFNKVTLPFLDPSLADQFKDSLPSVFIAPVGYKVPPGYKGHPLPYDPASVEALNQNRVSVISTTSGNDLEDIVKAKNPFLATRPKTPKRTSPTTSRPSTEESTGDVDTRAQTAFESRDPSRVVLDKLKLARNRPSLATFFNNRTKSGNTQGLEDDEVEAERKTRKRVLTKVVRKPFNPDTTTPSGVTNDLKSTVVRVVNIQPEDAPVEHASGITFDQKEDETTESLQWTTSEPHVDEIDVTTFQPAQEIKADHFAEPSQHVQTFVATTFSPSTSEIRVVTESSTSYEPTPADSKSDRLRPKQRKTSHKPFASFPVQPDHEELANKDDQQQFVPTSTEVFSPTTERPYSLIRNRLNLRKFGPNTGVNFTSNPFEVNSAANVYGQRIRARKRPSTWNGQDEEDQVGVDVSLQPKRSKADQYKKKFRPFFDQLYEQLTGNEQQKIDELQEAEEESPNRSKARLVTTAANPYTINAEIYEVHPDSRERITTTLATSLKTVAPVTSTAVPVQSTDYDANPRNDDQPEEDIVYVDTPSDSSNEYKVLPTTQAPAISDPLSDHEQQEPDQPAADLTQTSEVAHNVEESKWVVDEHSEVKGDDVLEDEEPITAVPKDVFVPVTSNQYVDENPKPYQPVVIDDFGTQQNQGRLHKYTIKVKPQVHQKGDLQYETTNTPIINEHTQQHFHFSEGGFIPFQPLDPEAPKRQYTEIQRKVSTPPTDIDDEFYIHHLVDQAYQLPAKELEEDPEVVTLESESIELTGETRPDETTTQTVFVTRKIPLEVDATEVPAHFTTVHPHDEEPTDVEPVPEFEANREPEEIQTTTSSQEYLEVTTFRPKVTPGFFKNFNLGNILEFILPSTSTELPNTTTPTPQAQEVVTDVYEETTIITTETPDLHETRTIPDISSLLDETDHQEDVTLSEVVEVDTTVAALIVEEDPNQEPEQTTLSFDVTTLGQVAQEEPVRIGRPKSIAQTDDNHHQIIEQSQIDIKSSNISKSVYGAIKREEYLKNWVASRKHHKFTEAGNKHGVIIAAPIEEPVTEVDIYASESTGNLPFVPTVIPNINKDDETDVEYTGVVIKKKRKKTNNPLLDKLTSSRKSLFSKSVSTLSSTSPTNAETRVAQHVPEYPRGSDTKIFKEWQGDSLSQAEFERKVLGVSTATEVSVKSVICVRGRCYNADNVPSFIGH